MRSAFSTAAVDNSYLTHEELISKTQNHSSLGLWSYGIVLVVGLVLIVHSKRTCFLLLLLLVAPSPIPFAFVWGAVIAFCFDDLIRPYDPAFDEHS